MDILFLLIPLSVVLIFFIVAVLAWSVLSGQFDEMEKFAELALNDATD
ncbi:MAG: cbb3-type cytochrome oxidase assembly protein CcoS [Burkholderiales bacterium]|nr:cbb3-type cytochrome oxidase assembly protein CcoS [Burkholderiales bacterium]